MKALFDKLSNECSKSATNLYSTSFSFGIKALNKKLHTPIYNIYGFVRSADEIVDSFHEYDKLQIFNQFKNDTLDALDRKISMNPILNSFQSTVHEYNIDLSLITSFLNSMEMDLQDQVYDAEKIKLYILGSAEVVGLMCLHVFTSGDKVKYNLLKPYAMKLGSAFQKVNFLRDINSDFYVLGRAYFPGVDLENFNDSEKKKIEHDIEKDFNEAIKGIKLLPYSSRGGVYLAYIYYYNLFRKIRTLSPSRILSERVRIPNINKLFLMFSSMVKHKLKLI